MDALVTTSLTKHYGHREMPVHRPGHRPAGTVRALEDLSIVVHEGEIFGFLGPNGAGKSTTIRLLLGYLHPTAGSASVLGLDIVRDSVEIRRRVGYLPGGIALYDSLSGERLLDYLGELTGRPSIRRAELLDRLELSSRTLRRPVRDYSRGMRQKIGIVQALQHDPELAVLDEPTEGLDPLMQRAFYGILDDLRAAGRTIFFSSHILSEVERVCDRVAIVRRGRLVALEDVARLLERRKRNVELRVDGDPPRLEAVPGVSGVRILPDGRIDCQLDGDVGPFLAAIAGHRVTDLTIEPAHLEEAFLELYEDAEPDGDDGTSAPEPVVSAPAPPTPAVLP
ncbi:MAG TPA: ABC transporter ATP-binding protein [Candidatus Limnocylindrales bacterium]|nr:ABC transporter ATP-binding protein [Candidatus Limnocylindrales bacterium]